MNIYDLWDYYQRQATKAMRQKISINPENEAELASVERTLSYFESQAVYYGHLVKEQEFNETALISRD